MKQARAGSEPGPAPSRSSSPPPTGRRPWRAPEVRELEPLTDLTLQTENPIEGSGNPGGGSTVF